MTEHLLEMEDAPALGEIIDRKRVAKSVGHRGGYSSTGPTRRSNVSLYLRITDDGRTTSELSASYARPTATVTAVHLEVWSESLHHFQHLICKSDCFFRAP